MTQFVFVKLSTSQEVRRVVLELSEVHLNLSTAPATIVVECHVLVELGDGVIIRSCSDIKHQAKLWLDIFADALEKPFMAINFPVISLFQGKNHIDSSAFEVFDF